MKNEIPCVNIFNESFCNKTKRLCIGCNGYEPNLGIKDNKKEIALPELPDNSNYRSKGKK
ncbi:MAG: hypothetical protein ABFD07_11495 [Methanobacterium sp.]